MKQFGEHEYSGGNLTFHISGNRCLLQSRATRLDTDQMGDVSRQ